MANSTADGSVVIDVDMNVSQAEKRLGKLRGDIKKTEKEISDMTKAKDEAKEKSLFQAAELDAEKAKLQEIKDRLADIRKLSKDKSLSVDQREAYSAQIPFVKQELDDQNARVRALQIEWNKTENAIDGYNRKIDASNQKLDDLKADAGILTQEIDEAIRKQNGFAKASAAAEKSMHRLGGRIMELVKSAFIFNVISAGLRAVQQITMKYIKTNGEARQAIAQLKGALLTLAQPLIEVIIPAFTLLVNILRSTALWWPRRSPPQPPSMPQAIPATTTINAPVVITIGTGTQQYPLTNRCCAQVTACGIRTRTRYSTLVSTSSTTGTFKLLGNTCPCPTNNLRSINGTAPAAPAAPTT